jgi:cytidylate kinase
VRVVAIDGPAGAGKSTVAREVARRLGLAHLDTGAMYRAVALAVGRRGLDPDDVDAVADVAGQIEIELGPGKVSVDGEDATAAVRSPEVNAIVSVIAANPRVRARLVGLQREWVTQRRGGVVEGRDIGTVVFPDADAKIYLTASDSERSRRRAREIGMVDNHVVSADMARRDELDSNRSISPLAIAKDATVIDTTERSVADVVDQIMSLL